MKTEPASLRSAASKGGLAAVQAPPYLARGRRFLFSFYVSRTLCHAGITRVTAHKEFTDGGR